MCTSACDIKRVIINQEYSFLLQILIGLGNVEAKQCENRSALDAREKKRLGNLYYTNTPVLYSALYMYRLTLENKICNKN